jgi:tetraacyldisaccharide 4'-kinase
MTSFEFTLPVVNVGNLRVGGTGKTPMVEYIIRFLLDRNQKVAIVSRGYGRKTKGFRLLDHSDTAATAGDEPIQYFTNFSPKVPIAVGEKRLVAIPALLNLHPEIDTIVLDDAFQHRRVKPGLNIVLSTFADPFFNDSMLPGGRLREPKSGISRANIVVFTKCNMDITEQEQQEYLDCTYQLTDARPNIYFTGISYGKPVSFIESMDNQKIEQVILITGLADDSNMLEYVLDNYEVVGYHKFGDHYLYRESDLLKIKATATEYPDAIILTSEKDATKLKNFSQKLFGVAAYYLPIEVVFLKNEMAFNEELITFVENYDPS